MGLRTALADKTPKEKVSFLWKHLKWHILIWMVGLLFLGYFLYQKITAPVFIMNGFLLNTENSKEDTSAIELADKFVKAYKVDTSDGNVILNDDFTYVPNDESKKYESIRGGNEILIQKQDGNIDFIIGYMNAMQDLSYSPDDPIFVDLREVLSKAEIEKYKPYFLYMDKAVEEKVAKAYENDKDISSVKLPDCTNPDKMKEPVPILIDLSHCTKLADIYNSPTDKVVFGFVNGAPSYDLPLDFLTYITTEEE